MRGLRWLWHRLRHFFRAERGGRSPLHSRTTVLHRYRCIHQVECPDCHMKIWCEVRLNNVTRYWSTLFLCPNCDQWCSMSIRVPIHEFV